MKIVIVGAGFTGIQLAKLLINEKNQVALIDNDEDIVRHAANILDCTIICDDGNSLETLEQVGIAKADALVCVTKSDEVNMITCSLVDAVYPDILKIARVRNYAYYVNTAEARKKHSSDFSKNHRPLYGIDYMIHPDVEAADAIVQAVENGAVGNVLTFDDSELEESYMENLQKLDALVSKEPEARLGKKLYFLVYDFISTLTDWEKETSGKYSSSELYAKTWTECRNFVLPMNPQRRELEYAIKSVLNALGVNIKVQPKNQGKPAAKK